MIKKNKRNVTYIKRTKVLSPAMSLLFFLPFLYKERGRLYSIRSDRIAKINVMSIKMRTTWKEEWKREKIPD